MCRGSEHKVTQRLSGSPQGGFNVLCLFGASQWSQEIGLFHNEDSKAQRGWVAHPGSRSPDKTLPGDPCSLPILGDGTQTAVPRFPTGGHGRSRVQVLVYELAGLGTSASSSLYWEELEVLWSWVTWDFKTYGMKAPSPLPGPRVGARCGYRS